MLSHYPILYDKKSPKLSKTGKKQPPHKPKTQGEIITLPEGLWLLQLIDYFQSHELLKQST